MIIDHDHGRVLDVLGNREKATVLAYLKGAKESGLLAAVEEVTTDMWDAYVAAAREAFGEGVTVTIDRFHVMKNFQDSLTAARRELQRGLSAEAKTRLKGSRWWWVTNPENLREEDRGPFARLRQEFPAAGSCSGAATGKAGSGWKVGCAWFGNSACRRWRSSARR